MLRADSLAGIPWLVHGFSTRFGGFSRVYGEHSLNLGFTKDDPRSNVERNREAFLRTIGATRKGRIWSLATLRQIHSDVIRCVAQTPEHFPAGDGLITSQPEVLLGVLTADCVPLILVDSKNKAVGIFHAGWRGTAKRIAEKGVGEMRRHFKSEPQDLRAAIGPGAGSCCYEIGAEVRQQFEAQFAYASDLFREVKERDAVREKYPLLFLNARAPGHGEVANKIFLDLKEANRRQLLSAGLHRNNISVSPLCTMCRTDLLFSHRAEKGITGRMMAVVGIKARLENAPRPQKAQPKQK